MVLYIFSAALWLSIQHGSSSYWEARVEFQVQSAEARTSRNSGGFKTRSIIAFDCIVWSPKTRGKFEESFEFRKAVWSWCMFVFILFYQVYNCVELVVLAYMLILFWLCLFFFLHWLVLDKLIIGFELGYNFCFSSLLCFPLFL